jgi:hypothetical protein
MTILAAFIVVPGCMVGSDASDRTDPRGDTTDDLEGYDSSTVSPLASVSNQRTAFEYFVARGLSERQSAGIVGNLIQESSVDPRAIEFGGGPGRGIAQWSTSGRWNASPGDNVTWYANRRNESRWSLKLQLEFTWYELRTFGGYGLGALRACRWTPCAAVAFERDFERCGQCDESKRIEYARAVYSAFHSSAMTADDEADVLVDGDEQRVDVEP